MDNICYKVVLGNRERFYSSHVGLGEGRLQYKLGYKTRPRIKNSKIFVFRCLIDAQTFVASSLISNQDKYYFVLKCFCKFSDKKPEMMCGSWEPISEKIKFWNGEMDGYACSVDGACYVDWVLPIHLI